MLKIKKKKKKKKIDEYYIKLDLFLFSTSGDIQNQYSEILSEKSVVKVFNIKNQEPFLISQLIINEIFDIYSIHLIPENDLDNNNEPKNDDKIDEDNPDAPQKVKRKRVIASECTIYL